MTNQYAALAVALLLAVLGSAAAQGNQDECNFETHHSHLVIPLAHSAAQCKQSGARFLLSHGATFFCPHTYDVKIVAQFADSSQQATLCDAFFASAAAGESIKYALRPTLPQNGLPATGAGLLRQWTSPVLYHVWEFGTNSSAGPGNGWNTTTIINADVTVQSFDTAYFREFDLATPRPPALSYLLFDFHGDGGASTTVLTHYITSAPNFDQILYVELVDAPRDMPRKNRWPLRLEIPDVPDTYDARLHSGQTVTAVVHSSDRFTGLPTTFDVKVRVAAELYSGIDDGFADFGFNCPFPPPSPQSRGLCVF